MVINKKLVALIVLGLAAAIVLFSVLAANIRNHRSIQIVTDTTPVKFELGDRVYALDNKEQDLSVSPGSYNYRATASVDGKKLAITGRLDLSENKTALIVLNYSIYNNDAVTKALCESMDSPDNCPLEAANLDAVYMEGNQWAVVFIDSPTLGMAQAVLRVDNGQWEVVDGPATDITTGGYFPPSVEEVVENGR